MKDQGKLDEAVACYRRALELKPDFAEAHNNLGLALKDQGKLDEAVACYRRALELKPDFAEAHYNLGNTLNDQGKLDEAVACYRRALELKPDFAEAHNNLGNALKDQGKLDEAVACYGRALELKPDYAEAHNNLGIALKRPGEAGRSARLLPPGTGTEAGLCRGALESIALVAADRGFPARLGRIPVALENQTVARGATFRSRSGTGSRWKEEPSSSMPSRGWAIPSSSSATLPWSNSEAEP